MKFERGEYVKNACKISVSAVALIAGSYMSVACAQDRGNQSPPASAQSSSPDATQKEQNRREPEMKRGNAVRPSAENPETGKKGNLQRAQDQNGERNGNASSDAKPEKKGKAGQRASDKPSNPDSSPSNGATTGQGANGLTKPSAEQRTKISSTIKQQNVRHETNVNFTLVIGSKVPRGGVTLHRLPDSIFAYYPGWRGYEYILVGDEIVVIDPRTMEIVDVIPI